MPRTGELVITVHQQITRQLRLREHQNRDDKDLGVPEDVAFIAEAGECLRAGTDLVIVTRRGN
jgi:hypothetical protein